MSAGLSAEKVKALLEAYASAFQRSDKDAVADRYACPVHVVTHNGGVRLLAVPSREAWTVVVGRMLQMYSAMGVRRAAMVDLRVVDVSPQIALAGLTWALHGEGDEQPKFMGVMRERG
jgi:ketosteroid isomerase-like protein